MTTTHTTRATRENVIAALATAGLAGTVQVFAGPRPATAEVTGRPWSAQTLAEKGAALDTAAFTLRTAGFTVRTASMAGVTEILQVS